MEKISLFIAKLKVGYPKFFNELTNEQLIEMISLYQEMLGNYNEETLNEVAKEIIKTKKFYPSMSEILEFCEGKKIYKRNQIIELMIKDKYFKSPLEIDKVYMWIEEGIIPSWLQEDMKKYYQLGIENKKRKLLES